MELIGLSTNFFALVEDRIQLVEIRMRDYVEEHHPDLRVVLDHLISSGGKRIRPVVALLTGQMLGADPDKLITLASSIEMLHTASLVHDDLIDGSLLRRGIPTLNAKWSPAATVLAGDYMFARAAELASQTDSIAVMQIFAKTLATVVNGEVTQLFSSRGVANREDYYRRIFAKTASMFVLATRAAGILSLKSDKVINAVHQYGYEVGMAFQIVDDILDFTGEQATVGKPVASDLRQGLVTLPALYYLEANPEDPDMQAVLSGEYQNEDRMIRLVESIRTSGAIDQAQDEAKAFVSRGLEALQGFPQKEEYWGLMEIGSYIVDRKI